MSGPDVTTRPDRRSDETGAVAIIGALFLVIALLSAALAIDIGQQVFDQRELRKVADHAALDAARAVGDRRESSASLDDLQAAAVRFAEDSAVRNGYDLDLLQAGDRFHVCIGVWDADVRSFHPWEGCPSAALWDTTTSAEPPDAVGVIPFDDVTRRFVGDDREIRSEAVASAVEIGGIAAGSRLATLDADESELLAPVMNEMLNDPDADENDRFQLSAASYEGLAQASIRLDEVATAIDAGAASPSEVLDTEITLVDLLHITASVLDPSGETHAEVSDAAASGAVTEGTFTLGDLLDVAVSDGTAVADAEMNVLNLLMGGAQAVNGDNLLVTEFDAALLDSLGLDVASMSLSMQVLEAPRAALGRVGETEVSTSQLRARLDVTVAREAVSLAGVTLATDLHIPIYIDAAGATAVLSGMSCEGDGTIYMDATTHGGTLAIADSQPPADPPSEAEWTEIGRAQLLLSLASIQARSHVMIAGPGEHEAVGFLGPFDWTNTTTVSSDRDVSSEIANDLRIRVSALGLLNIDSDLDLILEDVVGELVEPLLGLLGADLAEADLTAWYQDCGRRMLVR